MHLQSLQWVYSELIHIYLVYFVWLPIFFQFRSRQCWVCFGTEEDEPGIEWTSPCHCKGGTKYVHQMCIQHWVDEKQKLSSTTSVSCPQCQFKYIIKYPSANVILFLFENIERVLTMSSPLVLAGLSATTLYWSSFTYGITSLTLALGREQAGEFFSAPDSALAVVSLPVLPWIILAVKLIRPEAIVVRLWYRFMVPIISHILKGLPITSQVQLPVNHRFVPGEIHPLHYVSRCIFSTAVLPIISTLFGNLLFYKTSSGIRRTLMVRES